MNSTTLKHSELWEYGGYKQWAIIDQNGKTLFSGFSRNDCVDFWNEHNMSHADSRIVGLI